MTTCLTPQRLFAASLAGCACLVLTGSADAQRRESTLADPHIAIGQLQDALVDVIQQVEPCVVAISRAPAGVGNEQPSAPFSGLTPLEFQPRGNDPFQPSGAGVFIDASGLVLTQYLNVRSGDQHLITTTDGRRLPATIRAADPRSSLAVLEVEGSGLPFLEIGDADAVRKGQFVITVGNPQSILQNGEPSASWGTVTNTGQRASPTTNLNNTQDETGLTYATTLHHLGTLLQTDAKLNWTSGGGAVVDLSGKLVGITTTAGTLPGHESPAGYAIPMTSVIRRVVEDLKAGREVEYGLLGLRLDGPVRRTSGGQRGAVVSLTVPGGPAERAGLRAEDRLVKVDGKPIDTVSDLQLLVGSLPPGQPVSIGFIRNGQPMEVPVSLSKLHIRGEKIFTASKKSWRGMQVDFSTAIVLAEIERAAESSRIDPAGCVVVTDVEPGSPAAVAGVEAGTFISHVGDKRVASPEEFHDAVGNTNDIVTLRLTTLDNGNQPRRMQVESELERGTDEPR